MERLEGRGDFDKQWRSLTATPPSSRTGWPGWQGLGTDTTLGLLPGTEAGVGVEEATPQGGAPQHSPHAALSTGEPRILGHPASSLSRKAGSLAPGT